MGGMLSECANFLLGRKRTVAIERGKNQSFGESSVFCGKANAPILFFQYHISQFHEKRPDAAPKHQRPI